MTEGFGPRHWEVFEAARSGDVERFRALLPEATIEDKEWALEVAAHVEIARLLRDEPGVDPKWLRHTYTRARVRGLTELADYLEATADVGPPWVRGAWVVRVDAVARSLVPALAAQEFISNGRPWTGGEPESIDSYEPPLRGYLEDRVDPVEIRTGLYLWFVFLTDPELEGLGLPVPGADRRRIVLRVRARPEGTGDSFAPVIEAEPYAGELD